MENKPKFRPNPKIKLMDQVREVLRYHHYTYHTEQTLLSMDSSLFEKQKIQFAFFLEGTGGSLRFGAESAEQIEDRKSVV